MYSLSHMPDPMEHSDSHAMPNIGQYLEYCISPPLHLQHPFKDWDERRDAMYAEFKLDFDSIKGVDDNIAFMELSTQGGLYHVHGLLHISNPIKCLHTLQNLRFLSHKGKPVDRQIVAIYNITSMEHLHERMIYISKDYPIMKSVFTGVNFTELHKLWKQRVYTNNAFINNYPQPHHENPSTSLKAKPTLKSTPEGRSPTNFFDRKGRKSIHTSLDDVIKDLDD